MLNFKNILYVGAISSLCWVGTVSPSLSVDEYFKEMREKSRGYSEKPDWRREKKLEQEKIKRFVDDIVGDIELKIEKCDDTTKSKIIDDIIDRLKELKNDDNNEE